MWSMGLFGGEDLEEDARDLVQIYGVDKLRCSGSGKLWLRTAKDPCSSELEKGR
jgi:hypothetical protein